MKYVMLNNGLKMPELGIGTYDEAPSDAKRAVKFALQNGYRSIDTAHAYGNEQAVGEAIKESGVDRKEIWLTSKLWPSDYDNALDAIEKMLERLGTDYIDLLYVHQPVGNFVGAWGEMEEAVKLGKVRTLGISNFDANGYEEILSKATIKPAVIQLECHPFWQQTEMRKKLQRDNIVLESWFPLGGTMGNSALFGNETILAIAKTHGKSPAQVILKWHLNEGFIAIPGSIKENEILEDIDIYDFDLTEAEMNDIRSLEGTGRFFNMPFEELKKFILNWKID